MEPYGRLLNRNEPDEGRCGTSGSLGPRTEQFAIGSLCYFINYGYEVYGDRSLTDDPKEHGPKVMDLLQNMTFPELNGDPLIDGIIHKCWHNKYASISDLATYTEKILSKTPQPNDYLCGLDQKDPTEEFSSKKAYCKELEKRGLLRILSTAEPEKLGFSLEWYRHH